jgi:hypothetical protein
VGKTAREISVEKTTPKLESQMHRKARADCGARRPSREPLSRLDLRAKISNMNKERIIMGVSDQRICQKDLPDRLLESTQQQKRWYATTKETIKCMNEDAQRRKDPPCETSEHTLHHN